MEWHINEGDAFEPVKHIATIRGAVRFLLLGERVALNVLSRWEKKSCFDTDLIDIIDAQELQACMSLSRLMF